MPNRLESSLAQVRKHSNTGIGSTYVGYEDVTVNLCHLDGPLIGYPSDPDGEGPS